MGHDHHFLERLDRVEQAHLDFALSLYRDHLAVRWLLERLDVSKERRIALALGTTERGPYIVLAGDGGFVTCLGEGMRPGALDVVARDKVDDLLGRYKQQRTREQIAEDARRERESDFELLTRIIARGHEICREDIATLASFTALTPRGTFRGTFTALMRVFQDLIRVAKVRTIRPSHRESARAIYRTWWLGAHGILLAGTGTWDMTEDIESAAEADLTPTRIASTFGSTAHLARSAWAAASWTGSLEPKLADALVRCYENALHAAGHPLLALESTVALAVIATQHEERRAGIVRLLRSEAARTDLEDSTKLTAFAADTIERPLEASGVALDWGRARYRERSGEAGVVSDDLATAALLSDDANAQFDLDAARLLVQAAPVIAVARAEDFYFERSVAKKVIREWTPEDTLALVGRYPQFSTHREEPVVRTEAKVGRNDPCTCGSGRKYKKCCGA